MGNTAERLKHKVLGTRRRGLPAAGRFDHASGTGHVPCHAGDYVDAIQNRKAAVHLLVHETLGGMCSYSARRLRRPSPATHSAARAATRANRVRQCP